MLTSHLIRETVPLEAGSVVSYGRCWLVRWKCEGHAGIYIADDVCISANPRYGVRFSDWTNDFLGAANRLFEQPVTRVYRDVVVTR